MTTCECGHTGTHHCPLSGSIEPRTSQPTERDRERAEKAAQRIAGMTHSPDDGWCNPGHSGHACPLYRDARETIASLLATVREEAKETALASIGFKAKWQGERDKEWEKVVREARGWGNAYERDWDGWLPYEAHTLACDEILRRMGVKP